MIPGLQTLSQYQNQQQNLPFLLLLKLLQEGQNSQTEARSANEHRRNEIMDRDLDTRNRLLDYVGQYGKSMLDDVERADKSLRGRDTAALAAAGFLGASPDLMRGADIVATRARNENLAKVKDHLLQNAINVDERATNRLSDFQERITDAYPKDTTALIGQLGQLGGLFGNLFSGGGGGAYSGGGLLGQAPPSSGPKAATPTKYVRATAVMPNVPQPFNETAAMQQDSALQQRHNGPRPVPWNYGNPYNSYDAQPKHFIPAPGGGLQNSREAMPALGIFGAGVQSGNVGNGASFTFPYQARMGEVGRTPLWARDPTFASVLASKYGLVPGGFQIEGDPSSTSSTTQVSSSPAAQTPSWLANLNPILKLIGPYLSSMFGT